MKEIHYVVKNSFDGEIYSSPFYLNKDSAIEFFNNILKYEIEKQRDIDPSDKETYGEWEKKSTHHWGNNLFDLTLRSYIIEDRYKESHMTLVTSERL